VFVQLPRHHRRERDVVHLLAAPPSTTVDVGVLREEPVVVLLGVVQVRERVGTAFDLANLDQRG